MVDGPEFVDGVLISREKMSLDQFYAATEKALLNLRIPIVDRHPEQGTLFGRTSDSKIVRIQGTQRNGEVEIRIRVSDEPEQARARLILDQIRKQASSNP